MKTNFFLGAVLSTMLACFSSPAHAQTLNCHGTSNGGVTYTLQGSPNSSLALLTVVGGIENPSGGGKSVESANLTCSAPGSQAGVTPGATLLRVCDDGVTPGAWTSGFRVNIFNYRARIIAEVLRKGILGSRTVAEVYCSKM